MQSKQIKREEIDEKYKWDLTSIYKSEDEFNKDKEEFIKLLDEIDKYKGILTQSADTLYNYLVLEDRMQTIISNLFVYSHCKKDEDINNKENIKRYNEILNIDSICNEKSSFIMPELMKTDYEIIKKYINEDDRLKEYEFDLEMIYRFQKYTVSENEEKLLSNIDELQTKHENSFETCLYSIVDYETILDEENNEVKITNGNYSKYIRSKNRRVRQDAYNARGKELKKFASLFANSYEGHLKCDSISAKTKGYNSPLQMYLYPDGVTEEIYDNLLNIADKNINILYKYYKLIKHILKLGKLEVYDLLAPLTEVSNKKYTPEDCKEILLNAFNIYGEEYVSIIKKAFDERWIDFYPNEGKRSGYYENVAFKGNPVVFANYNDDLSSVSAIAHELGHAVHSYFSLKNNKEHLAGYKLIVAEVASLTNEIILSNYIINNSNDKNEKLNAISNILEIFASNFYGTLAEGSIFEKTVHNKVFKGENLTEEDFNNIFEDINKKYYGDDINLNEYTKYSWSRVSHFYSSFYYYKYSIGISCACYVAKRILSNDKEYLDKYLKFLSLGGSMMPLDELKTIDIDLSKEDVINEAIKYFDSLIDEYKKIYESEN